MIRTTIMADEEILYKINKIAQATGKSKAAIIREALAIYVTEAEAKEPITDPLVGLIGLAGDAATPTDVSDSKDEAYIMETLDPKYGFAVRDEEDPS